MFLLTPLKLCCNAGGGRKSPKPPSQGSWKKDQDSDSDAGLLLSGDLHQRGREAAGILQPETKLAPRMRPLSHCRVTASCNPSVELVSPCKDDREKNKPEGPQLCWGRRDTTHILDEFCFRLKKDQKQVQDKDQNSSPNLSLLVSLGLGPRQRTG